MKGNYLICKKSWCANVTTGKKYPVEIVAECNGLIKGDNGMPETVFWGSNAHMDNSTWELVDV